MSPITATSARVFVSDSSSRSPRRMAPSNRPLPARAEHVAEGQQLVGLGPRAGHGATVGDDVAERPAGRDAERAGGQRLLGHLAHPGDVLRRAGALDHRPLAHRRHPQRAVADEPADVDALRGAVEPAEVVAVRRPVPRQTLEDRPAGDVLDALHHLGEELAPARCDRGERDAAVAEHHARDAVPARRRRQRVPAELGVEVRVHVDEPGRDDASLGVDLAPAMGIDRLLDATMRSPAIATSARRGAAPVPSTTCAVTDDEINVHHNPLRASVQSANPAPRRTTPASSTT